MPKRTRSSLRSSKISCHYCRKKFASDSHRDQHLRLSDSCKHKHAAERALKEIKARHKDDNDGFIAIAKATQAEVLARIPRLFNTDTHASSTVATADPIPLPTDFTAQVDRYRDAVDAADAHTALLKAASGVDNESIDHDDANDQMYPSYDPDHDSAASSPPWYNEEQDDTHSANSPCLNRKNYPDILDELHEFLQPDNGVTDDRSATIPSHVTVTAHSPLVLGISPNGLSQPSESTNNQQNNNDVEDTIHHNPSDSFIRSLSSYFVPTIKHPPRTADSNASAPTCHIPTELPQIWSDLTTPTPRTAAEYAYVAIAHKLARADAPHYLFTEFIQLVYDMEREGIVCWGPKGHQFVSIQRPTLINRLHKLFTIPKFQTRWVPIENKETKQILNGHVWFQEEQDRAAYIEQLNTYSTRSTKSLPVPYTTFKEQIKSILNNRSLFGNLDNLNVNMDDFPSKIFSIYETKPGEPIDEIVSASWYRDTARRRNIGPNDFLLPLILYIDKTGTDDYQRYGLEPLLVTTAILKRKTRNNPDAWVTVGFIPDLELRSKSEKKRDRIRLMVGSSNRNYQSLLRVLLHDLNTLQQTGFEHTLLFGEYAKKVNVVVDVCLVIGDGKAVDAETGRFGVHTRSVRRQSCSCWTMYDDLDSCDPRPCDWIRTYQLSFPTALSYADGVFSEYSGAQPTTAKRRPIEQIEGLVDYESHLDHADTESIDEDPWSTRQQEENKEADTNVYKADTLIADEPLLDHCKVLSFLDDEAANSSSESDNSTGSPCRYCDDQLSRDELDKVWSMFKATYKTPSDARNLLHTMSQHQSVLAFHDILFGGDIYGISGLTPTDGLHTVKLGLWRYIASHVIELISDEGRSLLDLMSNDVVKPQRQGESKYFPRWNFSHGVTTLSRLTADEWGGVILTLIILFELPEGRSIYNGKQKRRTAANEHTLSQPLDVENAVYILELILCFQAWLSFGPFWSCGDDHTEQAARNAIATMMKDIKEHVPRKCGNGWKLIKFHELLHIPRDISRLGAPLGYDAYVGEKMLKTAAKKPAKTAQKQGHDTFVQQVAKRTVEHRLLRTAMLAFDDSQQPAVAPHGVIAEVDVVDHVRYKLWSTFLTIDITRRRWWPAPIDFVGERTDVPDKVFRAICQGVFQKVMNSMTGTIAKIQQKAGTNLAAKLDNAVGRVEITAYSELVLNKLFQNSPSPNTVYHNRFDDIKKKGLVIRSHPSYQTEGEWRDWVLLRDLNKHVDRYSKKLFCESGDEGEQSNSNLSGTPAKVLGIIKHIPVPVPDSRLKDGPGKVDLLAALQSLAQPFHLELIFKPVLSVLVHAASSHISATVITEKWSFRFLPSGETNTSETNTKMVTYEPVFELYKTNRIIDRVACFTPTLSIIDDLTENECKRQGICITLASREDKWGQEFFETCQA